MADLADDQETAQCRWCRRKLIGKPYYMGGTALIPGPKMGRAPACHYGGFVCSHSCDYHACVDQHSSMPGCGNAKSPDTYARQTLRRNWPEHYA